VKEQARVLGIDDGPFVKGQGTVPLVGVLVCPPGYVEGVLVSSCAVDGDDANEAIIGMVNPSRFREQVRMIMIDGVAFGGFNVVDISALSAALDLPVVTVARDEPDMNSITFALKAHFTDWEQRLAMVSKAKVRPVEIPLGRLFIASAGIREDDADDAVRRCLVRGCLPEPVRLAHLVATALVRGESRGKA